ncbi:hypothetical protein AXG93_3072s1010 [Marchantia polymorpha subsp. ruderalis]|uniref:Uncharacterized protein n=1 Tax=Marchantia polymorpha subsp. ruderalis TaxID=1480154 RepID=A0A176WEV5_MARPO|nr:hypothetical protein AXG93_3072s1010 [Marchantia polymorpha subsp. ruderalis]
MEEFGGPVEDQDGVTRSELRNFAMKIDAWRRHWSPDYLSITQGGVGTSGGVSGVVASGGTSSSTSGGTSEGTRSGSSGSTGGADGKGTRSGPSEAIDGAIRSGTSGRTGGVASVDTSSGTSSFAVGSLGVVASGLPTFNPIAKFFKRLRKNYQGMKTKKLKSLQEFERKTDESSRGIHSYALFDLS